MSQRTSYGDGEKETLERQQKSIERAQEEEQQNSRQVELISVRPKSSRLVEPVFTLPQKETKAVALFPNDALIDDLDQESQKQSFMKSTLEQSMQSVNKND